MRAKPEPLAKVSQPPSPTAAPAKSGIDESLARIENYVAEIRRAPHDRRVAMLRGLEILLMGLKQEAATQSEEKPSPRQVQESFLLDPD